MSVNNTLQMRTVPEPGAILTLFKPITWFPPVWAFLCGVVSAGLPLSGQGWSVLLGLILAGPLVCAMSQAANDWCDRHVDAINEPDRPIPSGRVPGRWGLYIALLWSAVSLGVGWSLGPMVLAATIAAVFCAWAYSAEPLRWKNNGWLGASICALCYEGLPWLTGTMVMLGTWPPATILALALLYSIGAIGIMILNDFKSVEGDTHTGVRSIPAMLGFGPAGMLACALMAVPQALVVVVLYVEGLAGAATVVAGLMAVQIALMPRFMADPRERAPWYNATGTGLYVTGMMVSAVSVGGWIGGAT